MPRRPGATRRTPSRIHSGFGDERDDDGTTGNGTEGTAPDDEGQGGQGQGDHGDHGHDDNGKDKEKGKHGP